MAFDAAAQVAEHLQARRTGPGRWIAKCPAHDDRSPSLSIAAGREGRALVRCFAGCDLAQILAASGLTPGSLFSGPRLKPQQLAAAAAERDRRQQAHQAQRETEREAVDWLRLRWQANAQTVAQLAHRLTLMPDDAPGASALTTHFHRVLMEQRLIDRAFEGETDDLEQ